MFAITDSEEEKTHSRVGLTYSVDIATNDQGKSRVVEIGDGQVSGLKEWPLEKFVSIFTSGV